MDVGNSASQLDVTDQPDDSISWFQRWTPDDEPGDVVDVASNGGEGWRRLIDFYAPSGSEALERVVEIAKDHGVVSVFVERRYIDLDFRSEHAQFYGGTFRRYPSVCHRLHFFTAEVDASLSNLEEMRNSGRYRGYSVMRPIPTCPVGRTMLAPPPSMEHAAMAMCTDEVDLFGIRFTVVAAPFISQDEQYSRCSHADMWMVLYFNHLEHRHRRYHAGEIHKATQGGEVHGRDIPSDGLTPAQMLYGLQQLGLSPSQLELPQGRRGRRPSARERFKFFQILCRAVDSLTPPIVVGEEHVWLIVGYMLVASKRGPETVLVRHDDARGPYLEVPDPWNEPLPVHNRWEQAIIPLPLKIYLTGERAQILGEEWFMEGVLEVFGTPEREHLIRTRGLEFRTYAIRSTQFKQDAAGRLPPEIAELYQFTHMPRYVWVTELIDVAAVLDGNPCCLGEIIIDATAHHLRNPLDEMAILSVHVAGAVIQRTLDHEQLRTLDVELDKPYNSGCVATRSLRLTTRNPAQGRARVQSRRQN